MTNSNGHTVGADRNEILVDDDDAAAPSQAVKVAVHVRPLIAVERLQGCKDCVTITPGRPQVQIGSFSYTYDHVYGSSGTPAERIFEECVSPLVEGLFNGYNATVLAYGQIGSGKTYTMGTGDTVADGTNGIIPKVIEMLFQKIEEASEKVECQICVSFIEILNEELHDLLICNDSTTIRPDMYVGANKRPTTPTKSHIQIRETTDGEITMSGVTEIEVRSMHQMTTLLEQGSLSRATASTNMNSNSSRSHAILKMTLRQRQKIDVLSRDAFVENLPGDCLHAKVHLVDLAGSERVKRTGADGLRFKEGVHINKGLLALGNVISALGDDKKRKESGHVPYRDSKLTRILQDSLGGNSRTVMIACISPADSNAEESLNTLKYANRARNIQNKPIVNRDPVVAEMHELRQQLESLQTELLCYRAGGSPEDILTLKRRIAWLETDNSELKQELQQARDGLQFCAQRVLNAFIERDALQHKIDLLRSGKTWEEVHGWGEYQTCNLIDNGELLQAHTTKASQLETHIHYLENGKPQNYGPCILSSYTKHINNQNLQNGEYMELHEDYSGNAETMSKESEEDEDVAKEMEHTHLQVSMDKELQQLNERLQRKEAEMTLMINVDNLEMKHQFAKKLFELEEEKKLLQMERDKLLLELENLSCVSDEQTQKMQEAYADKLKNLESQLSELKQKQESQTLLLKQKLHNNDAEKHLQEEIQRIKVQKVQLQHRMKQESEYFRCWKAGREKELMKLKRDGRRNEHEMLKLQVLNQRQKMVLQRKTEEAALATRRLKEILESHRSSTREMSGTGSNANGSFKLMNQKALHQSVDNDIEVAVHIHEVRFNYEKQSELRASLAEELEKLLQEGLQQDSSSTDACTIDSMNSTSPPARRARIEMLKSMLDTSSKALVAMASELSEAEERERMCLGPSRWKNLRTMGDAKGLLNHVLNSAVAYRCHLWDLNKENKDLKKNLEKLMEKLKQSDAYRREAHRQQQLAEHAIGKAIRTSSQVDVDVTKGQGVEKGSFTFSHTRSLDTGDSFPSYTQSDMFSTPTSGSQYGFRKINSRVTRAKHNHPQLGKLLRWKRSHERWLLQFKWKWQKPWRLSEWIRHGDESFIRTRPSRMLHDTDFHWGSHASR